jgi:hypothetical protein
MHAVLTMTTQPASIVPKASLPSCPVQPQRTNPRMGIPNKVPCLPTTASKPALVPSSSATLDFKLTSSSTLAPIGAVTAQIRNGTTVLFVLSASSGTLTIAPDQISPLLHGHDFLYVQIGTHTYHGKIKH